MKKLLVMDAADYEPTMKEIRRIAVRGIILRNGKLLMIRNNFGEVKLPGGGKEGSETDEETLAREVLEETGFRVLPESIRPFGYIEEKRLSTHEARIWHQFSRIYFCDIAPEQGQCHYTPNEKKHGFRPGWFTPEEAMQLNGEMIRREGKQPWNQREYETLKLIRAALSDQ